ncbi:membrane-spanning 4-domains subfamily A member 12-like [Heteronotia binoei]|uniref:membrane-spanning 4-domains subfamily A member 12-like n=1 Tax=Heteronotia binoei TaxID=13085 RepID=UPI00292F370A|nr:membrane-spanning 4-domains subfamily A member 12-like [Heteronotia binoei]
MATDPQNGTILLVPSYGANVIQAGQIIPGTVFQPGGVTQYAGQPISPSQQNPQAGVLEKMLKVEAKTLGAIQIMIGLIHIGFGAVSLTIFGQSYYLPLAAIGGYPFWGAVFFIISGSLSVSAENHLSKPLVKSSVGMNITSAVMALTGVILYISELLINVISSDPSPAGLGLGVLLLLFSLLEFCITVSTAHFGCHVACCNNDPAMVFVPYTVSGGVACAEGNPAPPAYEAVSLK